MGNLAGPTTAGRGVVALCFRPCLGDWCSCPMERDGDRGLFRTPDDDAERAPMQVDESKPPLPEWFKIFLWDYDGLCIYIYISVGVVYSCVVFINH